MPIKKEIPDINTGDFFPKKLTIFYSTSLQKEL